MADLSVPDCLLQVAVKPEIGLLSTGMFIGVDIFSHTVVVSSKDSSNSKAILFYILLLLIKIIHDVNSPIRYNYLVFLLSFKVSSIPRP